MMDVTVSCVGSERLPDGRFLAKEVKRAREHWRLLLNLK
jgi:hypothetical protein